MEGNFEDDQSQVALPLHNNTQDKEARQGRWPLGSVADPDSFSPDLDPAFQVKIQIRIRIRRILMT
jgi:hypothetical protein